MPRLHYAKAPFARLHSPDIRAIRKLDGDNLYRWFCLIELSAEYADDGALTHRDKPWTIPQLAEHFNEECEPWERFITACLDRDLITQDEDCCYWIEDWDGWYGIKEVERKRENGRLRTAKCRANKAKEKPAEATPEPSSQPAKDDLFLCVTPVTNCNVSNRVEESRVAETSLKETRGEVPSRVRAGDETPASPPSPPPARPARSQKVLSDAEFLSRIRSCYLALMEKRMPDSELAGGPKTTGFLETLKTFPWSEYAGDYAAIVNAVEKATQRVLDAKAAGKLKHGKNLWCLCLKKAPEILLQETRAGPVVAGG